MIEHHLVVLAANAGLLVAAERGVGGIQVIAVDPDAAGLNTPSETIATVCVPAPDSCAQSVRRIVGDGQRFALIPERCYRQNRSEDFFLEDPHFVIAAEDGGLNIITVRQFPR